MLLLSLAPTVFPQVSSPAFPSGKGIWIWLLSQSEGGDVAKIIAQLQDTNVRWVALKCGDGEQLWLDQCNAEVITQFHDVSIKVYGWQYVYGDQPISEAGVANAALDLGLDGFIVDAEAEYEGKPASAITYMQTVRNAHPTSFIAYTSFPIISYHTTFPYLEFGKCCDAVMPQAYWQAIGVTPHQMITWMELEWNKWEQIWQEDGHGDSVKPIIPIGQSWDVSGGEIQAFANEIYSAGYQGVSLWVYSRMTTSMWAAYKNSFDHGAK